MSCQHQSRTRKAPMGRYLVVLLSAAYTIVLLRLHRALDDHHHHHRQEESSSSPSSSHSHQLLPYERLQAAQRFWSKQQPPENAPTSAIHRQQAQNQSPKSSALFDEISLLARPSSSYVIDPTDLWEEEEEQDGRLGKNDTKNSSSNGNNIHEQLPDWMKNYFRWHKETRQMLLRQQQQQQQHKDSMMNGQASHSDDDDDATTNTTTIRYLILSCPARSRKCGGLADRLMPLPFLVLLAAKTQRLFLIQWGRPAPLEEFLVPPVGGVDWRADLPVGVGVVAAGTSSNSSTTTAFARNEDDLLQLTQNSSLTTVQCRFQSHDHGSLYYDKHARSALDQQEQQQLHQEQHNNNPHAATTSGSTTMQHVMRNVWHVFFTPAPAVAQVVTQFMNQHRIVPGHYMASHLRALYGVPTREDYLVKHWTRNAVNCTIMMMMTTMSTATNTTTNGNNLNGNGNGIDIDESVLYFASDSDFAMRVGQRYGAFNGIRVVQRQGLSSSSTANETTTDATPKAAGPLHLDKTIDWRHRPPSDFYDTFVDLLLMANARCVGYGMGGFGMLAAWLSSNVSCSMQHHRAVGATSCQLPETATTRGPHSTHAMQIPHRHEQQVLNPNLVFVPPMAPSPASSTDRRRGGQSIAKATTATTPRLPNTTNIASPTTLVDGTMLDPPFPNHLKMMPPMVSNLWEGSTALPRWMKDYFVFHQESRKRLTAENWRSSNTRYLIVECMEDAAHCGGTADRLRPIPFYVRLAAETRRLLFVHWDKPKPLEAFLLPPVGGMDWRLPWWLHDELGRQTTFQAINKLIPAAQDEARIIVQARIQAHDHGSKYYNTQGDATGDGPDSFRQHYHDCWYVLFTPVPAIAKLVTEELEKLHLIPGEFAFAHLRALYGIEQQTDGRDFESYIRPWTRNALNCLSHLRPGGPFLFSSDSDLARQVAVDYGRARNTTVVARLDAPKPLHLDLVPDWDVRNASDFYDIFVDLYLMSQGRCMSYNMGGYGKWAQLISGRNFTCNVRHWTKGVNKASANKEGCNWTKPSSALVLQHKNDTPTGLEKPLFLPPMKEDRQA